MVCKDRKVLLFMDDAGCHPEELRTKFSNILICFLPPKTTSVLQLLDLGIMRMTSSSISDYLWCDISIFDKCDKVSDVVKSGNLLGGLL